MCSISATEGNYLGCYTGNFDYKFDLRQYQNKLTPSKCDRSCAYMNYTHFGLSNGTFCYCGFNQSLENLENISDTKCNVFCIGSAKCGSETAMAVYEGTVELLYDT